MIASSRRGGGEQSPARKQRLPDVESTSGKREDRLGVSRTFHSFTEVVVTGPLGTQRRGLRGHAEQSAWVPFVALGPVQASGAASEISGHRGQAGGREMAPVCAVFMLPAAVPNSAPSIGLVLGRDSIISVPIFPRISRSLSLVGSYRGAPGV